MNSIYNTDPIRKLPWNAKLMAPWTKKDILRCIQRQLRGYPYICPDDRSKLTPTRDGWLCDTCGYIQGWTWLSDLPTLPRTGRVKIIRYYRWQLLLALTFLLFLWIGSAWILSLLL